VRVLLLADAVVLAVVGGIALAFVERPAGVILALGAWIVAAAMLACLPLTDPYRQERRRRGDV